jgi:pullulanase
MNSSEEIQSKMHIFPVPPPLLGFTYLNPTGMLKDLMLFINPTPTRQSIQLPDGDWSVLADEKICSDNPSSKVHLREIKMEPISLIIIGKN